MTLLIIVLLLILLFGGGGFYAGGPYVWPGSIVSVLLIVPVLCSMRHQAAARRGRGERRFRLKRFAFTSVLIFKIGICWPETVVAMQLATETDRSRDFEFISIPDVSNYDQLPSVQGSKIQAVQPYPASQVRLRYRQGIAKIENYILADPQESGCWREGDRIPAEDIGANGYGLVVKYSISTICYYCGRSADISDGNNALDLHAISNRSGWHSTQHTIERYSADAQSWPVSGDEGSVAYLNRFLRQVSLTAGGDPENKGEYRDRDSSNRRERAIILVNKNTDASGVQTSATPIDFHRVMENGRTFVNCIIVFCVLAVVYAIGKFLGLVDYKDREKYDK